MPAVHLFTIMVFFLIFSFIHVILSHPGVVLYALAQQSPDSMIPSLKHPPESNDDISKWSQRIVDQTVNAEVENKHFAAGGVSEMPPDFLWNRLQLSLLGRKVTVKSQPAKPILTSSSVSITTESTTYFSAASATFNIYTSSWFLETMFSTSTSKRVLFKMKKSPKSASEKPVSTSTVMPRLKVSNSLMTLQDVRSGAHASLLTVTLGQPNRRNWSPSGLKTADTFTSSFTRDAITIRANQTITTLSPKGVMKINTTKAFVFVGIVLGLVAIAVTAAIVIKKNIGQWTCLR